MSLQSYDVKEGYDTLIVAQQAGIRRVIAEEHLARQVGTRRRVSLFIHIVTRLGGG